MRIDWAPWVNGSRAWARVSCPGAIDSHVSLSDFEGCRDTKLPAVPKTNIQLGDCPSLGPDGKSERDEVCIAKFNFRARVGELLWITRVGRRPDISHAVNDLARVAHNPGLAHVRALQHVSRYLDTTPRVGLLHEKPAALAESYPVGWTDANYLRA
jgi:hypothetical protein